MYNSGRRFSEPIHLGYSSQSLYEDLFNAPIPGTDILSNPFGEDNTFSGASFRTRTPRSEQNPSNIHNSSTLNASDIQLPQIQSRTPDAELPLPWLSNSNLPSFKYAQKSMSPQIYSKNIPETIPEEEKDERLEDSTQQNRNEQPQQDFPCQEGPTNFISLSSINPNSYNNSFMGSGNGQSHILQRTCSTPGRVEDCSKKGGSPLYMSESNNVPATNTYNYMYASQLYAQQQMMAQYMRAAYANGGYSNGGGGDPYMMYKQAQAHHQYYLMNQHFLTPPHSGNMSVTSSPLNMTYKELPQSPLTMKKIQPSNTPNGPMSCYTMAGYPMGMQAGMAGIPHGMQAGMPHGMPMYSMDVESVPMKVCSNCGCTSTPSWRRCPNGKQLLCNACGLYQKLHNKPRPFCILDDGSVKVQRTPGTETNICSNCHTTDTPLWRRGSMGEALCNACGLYFKQHRQSLMHQMAVTQEAENGNLNYNSNLSGSSNQNGNLALNSNTDLKNNMNLNENINSNNNPLAVRKRSRSEEALENQPHQTLDTSFPSNEHPHIYYQQQHQVSPGLQMNAPQQQINTTQQQANTTGLQQLNIQGQLGIQSMSNQGHSVVGSSVPQKGIYGIYQQHGFQGYNIGQYNSGEYTNGMQAATQAGTQISSQTGSTGQ